MVRVALPLVVVALALAGCDEAAPDAATAPVAAAPAAKTLPEGHPAIDGGAAQHTNGKATIALHTGKVLETMTSGGYTYALLETSQETIWIAGPQTELEVGQTISVPDAVSMENFSSPTLGRTFDQILFVQAIHTATLSKEAKACHAPPEVPDIAAFEPAEDGYSVGEIYSRYADLDGKQVKIRGQVVKFSPNILGTNWVHIQDGTGSVTASNYDVAITTGDTVAMGDIVMVSGQLATNRDFGGGYHYDILIEDARLKVE